MVEGFFCEALFRAESLLLPCWKRKNVTHQRNVRCPEWARTLSFGLFLLCILFVSGAVMPCDERGTLFLVSEAVRVHPVPSRTRSLSSPAPMVLGGQLPGSVGRRQVSCSPFITPHHCPACCFPPHRTPRMPPQPLDGAAVLMRPEHPFLGV